MKNFNSKYYIKIIFLILITSFIFLATTCVKKVEITPPKAEISNIYEITDSSAKVNVHVIQQSNAEHGGLVLEVDSLLSTNEKIKLKTIYFNSDTEGYYPLKDNYIIKISDLYPKSNYYVFLIYVGTFDLGGPSQTESFNLGSGKLFSTI